VFTVIVLSRAARERYLNWKEIFQPYLEEGQIAICDWNAGQGVESLNDAIPDLSDTIKGRKEWRLLAVGTATEGLSGRDFADPENPFDYIENWRPQDDDGETPPGLSLEESRYPLVRLSHMLLGYPEMGTNMFFPDRNYWDRLQRRRVYESEYVAKRAEDGISEAHARQEFAEQLISQHDIQTHYRQGNFTEEQERKYRQLIRKYEVRQSAPTEVVFVAIREPKPQRPTDELRDAWQRGEHTENSQFVARNDYHPACRFVVFDLHSVDHSAFELGELRFWLSVLTISINDIPASSFQADRLYQIDVAFDSHVLAQTLNEHMGRLASARERLNREIERPQNTVSLDVKDFLQDRPVSVSFEHLSGEHLAVSTSGYRLANDHPVREMSRLDQSYADLLAAAEQFSRKPRRVLAKAVEGMRNSSEQPAFPTETLTRIEREELEEELSHQAHRLSDATTRDILDPDRLTRLIDKERDAIRDVIRERMGAKTITWSSLLVGAIWLAVFIPFVVAAFNDGGVALTESLLVVVGVLTALAGVALLTLFYMRRKLISRLRALNSALRRYVNDTKNKASAFGDFLGSLRTYMFGRALLDADSRKAERDRRQNQEYLRDLLRIQAIIDREKSLVRSVNEPVEIKRMSNINLDLVAWSPERLRELLALPPSAPGNTGCVFNASGDRIQAPYDFVTRLFVSDLALRENHQRHRQITEDTGVVLPKDGWSS
jgi:hypothetical protein